MAYVFGISTTVCTEQCANAGFLVYYFLRRGLTCSIFIEFGFSFSALNVQIVWKLYLDVVSCLGPEMKAESDSSDPHPRTQRKGSTNPEISNRESFHVLHLKSSWHIPNALAQASPIPLESKFLSHITARFQLTVSRGLVSDCFGANPKKRWLL